MMPLAALLLILATACAPGTSATGGTPMPTSGQDTSTITITGTVQFRDLEGGLYLLHDGSGAIYQPTMLAPEFRQDGLAITAEVRRRDDVMTIGMAAPVVEVLRIERRTASATSLADTRWQLDDLSGSGVLDDAQTTLDFGPDGTVSGSSGCNRYTGRATISGSMLRFGPLAGTRRACAEAVMDQETRFLRALEQVGRYEVQGAGLVLRGEGVTLRFSRR